MTSSPRSPLPTWGSGGAIPERQSARSANVSGATLGASMASALGAAVGRGSALTVGRSGPAAPGELCRSIVETLRQAELDAVNAEKKRIEWGSQIRSYVLHPYRLVKDVRTGREASNVDRVLDGDLIGFMEAWLALDSRPS